MLPQTMFPVVRDPSCACPPVLLNSTMFGGVWRVDTAGNLTLYTNVGEAAQYLVSGDNLLLWGEVTETVAFTIDQSVSIGSAYHGKQPQTNWDLAGFNVTLEADAYIFNLHIQSAEHLKVATTAGITVNFSECALYLVNGDFAPDAAFNSLWYFNMNNCYVTGDPGVTEFMVGVPNGKAVIQVNNSEFRNIETRWAATFPTGAMRFFGTQFFNNDAGNFYSILVEGDGLKFFQGCRFYGLNNSAVAAVGVFHVAAGTDDLRLQSCQMRANKGANNGYGFVFQDDTITGVVIANTWAEDYGTVTSMLYAPPAGITIRGPNSTFDGAAFVNVTVTA